jgi:hypothetical protein
MTSPLPGLTGDEFDAHMAAIDAAAADAQDMGADPPPGACAAGDAAAAEWAARRRRR